MMKMMRGHHYALPHRSMRSEATEALESSTVITEAQKIEGVWCLNRLHRLGSRAFLEGFR